MLWGDISIDGHMDLVIVHCNLTAAGYIEQIQLQHVLDAAYGVGPEFVLMHDNARAHLALYHQSCLVRTGHSRDGMANSES